MTARTGFNGILSRNRPPHPVPLPLRGERVLEGPVRGGSWSQCVRKSERRLSSKATSRLRVGAADTTALPVNGGLVSASRLSSPSTVNSLRVSFLACFDLVLTSTKGK